MPLKVWVLKLISMRTSRTPWLSSSSWMNDRGVNSGILNVLPVQVQRAPIWTYYLYRYNVHWCKTCSTISLHDLTRPLITKPLFGAYRLTCHHYVVLSITQLFNFYWCFTQNFLKFKIVYSLLMGRKHCLKLHEIIIEKIFLQIIDNNEWQKGSKVD
jgi:hypothetical protein